MHLLAKDSTRTIPLAQYLGGKTESLLAGWSIALHNSSMATISYGKWRENRSPQSSDLAARKTKLTTKQK
jgi:hypothetical protein